MGDAINVFLFPDLSPSESPKVALLARSWYAILGGGSLTSFEETSLLLAKQQVYPVTIWEAAEKQLEALGVLCHVFLEDAAVHPVTYEVCNLIEETTYIGAILREQTQRHPAIPITVLCLLQMDFNKIFCQGFERHQRVRWPDFERLKLYLDTGNFRPESIALPGAFTPQAPVA